MAYIKYYGDLINRDVPIKDVIQQYLGETPDRSGKVHCPSPAHEDKHPSASINTKNGNNYCYCFSCSKGFSPISIVMENVTNGDFRQACEMLINDFGLSMSQYSNYDEVQAEKRGLIEAFPFTADDCKALNFDAISLKSEWLKDKEEIEEIIFERCKNKVELTKELIAEETACFYNIYASHTEEEWKRAEEMQAFREKNNLTLISSVKLNPTDRELANELVTLHGICERIADLQDYCKALEKIPSKINRARQERNSHDKTSEKRLKSWSGKTER